VARPEGSTSLGSYKCSWEDNIKTDLTEIELSAMDYIPQIPDMGQWRAIVNTVMNLRFP
jgi:hypothetical protein